ncbi:hypothetical protein RSAG8_05881, partial [Rhizoctonia solani AG-8 WAC10335]
MWGSYLAKIPYIRFPPASVESEKKTSPLFAETTRSSPKPTSYQKWSPVMGPLIGHALMAVGITVFMTSYVDHRYFNVERRRPFVKLGATEVPWAHYAPLQTDITTALSIMLAVLRLMAASTLLVVLPVHLSAPVLTGSIEWKPSNPPRERLSNDTLNTPITRNYEAWNMAMRESDFPTVLKGWVTRASASAFRTWGVDTSNDALKRYNPDFWRLRIDSTVANVTLPYFIIQSIEWIDNPNSTLSSNQFDIVNSVCPKINMTGPDCPIMAGRALALVPDTPWTNQSSYSPSKVAERRLMVYKPTVVQSSPSGQWECMQGGDLNPDVSAHQEGGNCWKFAWVTYSAGVATYYDCRVPAYGTLQNDTALVLQEGYMTAEALRMVPSVINNMLSNEEVEVTLPRWRDPNDYVIGMLTRAYAGAWMTLNDYVGAYSVYTTYSVSPQATRAMVSYHRVYIWLGLQSLVTLSGILFLYIQSQSSTPMIVDTTLAAFHLDSSALHEDGAYKPLWGGGGRKAELEGGFVRVKAEQEK